MSTETTTPKRGVLYTEYLNDEAKEKGGVFLDFGPIEDGSKKHCRILVARAGGANNAFEKMRELRMRPHRRAQQAGTLANRIVLDILKTVLIKTVILGWENVAGLDGKILEFTEKNVRKILDDLPDLYDEVLNYATDRTVFREEQEADVKN